MRPFAVLCLLLAGCPDADPGANPDMTVPPSITDQCRTFAAARQAARLACSGVTTSYALIAYSEWSCVEAQTEFDSGYLTFDDSKLPACLAALKSAPCEAREDPAECAALFVAHQSVGAPCFTARDCKTGSACLNAQCPGTCKPLGGEGQPCDVGCLPGLDCGSNTICVKPPAVGQACPDFRCATGAYCDSIDKMCKAQKDTGAACTTALECKSEVCRGQLCALHGRLNDPCSVTDPCLFGLACDGVCKPWQGDKQVCHHEADCSPELNCTTPGGGDGTCFPWLHSGDPCDPAKYQCFPGTVCKNGTCQHTEDCS